MNQAEWLDAILDHSPRDDAEAYRIAGEVDSGLLAEHDLAAGRRQLWRLLRRRDGRSTLSADRAAIRAATGEAPLPFAGLPEASETVDLRATLVGPDGALVRMASLAGPLGAETLRAVADRDSGPARTTLVRCATLRRLAGHIEAESRRLDRDVAVGEVVAGRPAPGERAA